MNLGIYGKSLRVLVIAALLHDIGKIWIPTQLLNKSGKLTSLEYEIIKEHPQKAYELLKNCKLFKHAAKVVLQHHEREDGSGYPFGLNSSQILMESKIIAVADTFDAMCSHRPYRARLHDKELFEQLLGCKGKLNERVIDAFLAQVQRNKVLGWQSKEDTCQVPYLRASYE
ncbi:hypothetical protein JCM12178A_25040 [Salidesulfovibrio brasiliensis]